MNIPEQTAWEEIEKGLARLNGAWQILKKEKEDYQRAREVYETFYAWLQARATFSLDTTTGFYRLDTNEASIYELKKDIALTQEEIDTKIATMNQAEHDYDQASTPEQQKAADIQFSTCWDWLIENKVLFYRDTKERVYRSGKKLV